MVEHYAPITHIDFSAIAPHEFAVTSASRIQIYDPNTNTVKRQIARFNNDGEVFSGSFRLESNFIILTPTGKMEDCLLLEARQVT